LVALSGAQPDILTRFPTERIKYQSLGWAILITCVMAALSMWFALTSVLGFNPVAMVPVALAWGLIIMGIDRWLVTSMPIDGSRKLAMALPRLVLALLLGSLISTPIVLRAFQSEINNQISIIKEQRAAAFITSQQNSAVQQQVTHWQAVVTNLQRVIESQGAVPINPNSDQTVQALQKQEQAALALEQQYYRQWQCQLYGGGGCGAPAGNGPLAQASQQRYLQETQQVSSINGQIQAREAALQTSDAQSQVVHLAQAKGALPAAQIQLQAAQQREDSLVNNFDNTNAAANGLLLRLQALDQLSAGNNTLNGARFLLFLLFLVIECLPVTVKLLQRPGNYERFLQTVAKRELNAAHRSLNDGESADEAAQGSGAGGDLAHPRRGRDKIDDAIGGIWRHSPPPGPASPPGWPESGPGRLDSEPSADPLGLGEDDLVRETSRQEDALRNRVVDTRAFPASRAAPPAGREREDGHRLRDGGIEQHYRKGDL
jgi:hypothetical protein